MKAINELSTRVLVVTSVQGDGRHSKPVLCTFKKRIHVVQKEGEKHGSLKAELYNQGHSKNVNLKENLKSYLNSNVQCVHRVNRSV
jgi:hypothetical protein